MLVKRLICFYCTGAHQPISAQNTLVLSPSKFLFTWKTCHDVKCTLHFRKKQTKRNKKHSVCIYPFHLTVSCTLSFFWPHGNQTSFVHAYSLMGLLQSTKLGRAGTDVLLRQLQTFLLKDAESEAQIGDFSDNRRQTVILEHDCAFFFILQI